MHNIETEESLLCCLINKPSNIVKVSKWIENDDVFYNSFNKDLWKTIRKMHKNGETIDAVSVVHKFPSKKHSNKSIAYDVSGIATKEPSYAQAENYAKLIHEHWLRRRMVDHSHNIIKTAEDNSVDLDSLINKLNNDSSNLINLRPSNNEFDIDQVLNDTNDSIFNSRGIIKTGLEKLDSVIHGMTRGEITIIAGRPANGKTTVAANIARALVLSGKKVVMFNRRCLTQR